MDATAQEKLQDARHIGFSQAKSTRSQLAESGPDLKPTLRIRTQMSRTPALFKTR